MEERGAEKAAAKSPSAQCHEFVALAVPNVMGGGLLLYLLGSSLWAAGIWQGGLWLALAAAVAGGVYFNVGEPVANNQAGLPECKVAFLGLGRMGSRMAANLARHHVLQVHVWNRSEETARAHAEAHGSKAFPSAKEAAADCDFVFLCLPTTAVVAEVTSALKLKQGAVVIDSTSGEPELSKRIAQELSCRGATYLDAPVSGGPKGAQAGTLTVMVGGDKSAFERVLPLLRVVGSAITHVGPVGSGHAVKAVNNALNASALLLSAEGLLTLAQHGVAPDVALSVINKSSGRNLATQQRIPEQVLSRKFDFGFALKLMSKDNNIANALLREGLKDGYINKTAGLLTEAAEAFGGEADFTACVKLLEKRAGIELAPGKAGDV